MEIELNTSRIAQRDLTPATTRTESAPASADSMSFSAASSLESQLQTVPAARVDKVELAKTLITNPNYPPQELLDRIAALLAVKGLN